MIPFPALANFLRQEGHCNFSVSPQSHRHTHPFRLAGFPTTRHDRKRNYPVQAIFLMRMKGHKAEVLIDNAERSIIQFHAIINENVVWHVSVMSALKMKIFYFVYWHDNRFKKKDRWPDQGL